MSNNPNNVKLSACRVRWGGRDIGLTKGGVDVTIKTDTKMVQVDQFGNTPIGEYITGRTLTVKCPFAETDLDTLYAITQQAGGTMVDNGTTATGTLTFGSNPANNDFVIVNGHKFTFVTAVAGVSTPVVNTVYIGTTAALTIANLFIALQACTDPNVEQGIYTSSSTTIGISFYRSGVVGNGFTLAKSSTAVTLSGATLTGGVDGTQRYVNISASVGLSLYATAMPLILHPINKADNDFSEDFVIPLASTPANITFSYKFDNERVYTVDFTGYPDPVYGNLCYYGATAEYNDNL